MIKKKLMKHFKLRSVMKTMVLATAVTCGLFAGTGTVKAATATPTPTPYPTQNYIVSTNNYESDDWDYDANNNYIYPVNFGIKVNDCVNFDKLHVSAGGLYNTTNITQISVQKGTIYVEYPLNIISNSGVGKTIGYPHTLNQYNIGSQLLYIDEDGNTAEKDVSKNLTYEKNGSNYCNTSKDDIHIGLPIEYIYPEGKTSAVGGIYAPQSIIIKVKKNIEFSDSGNTYKGTLYTVVNTVNNEVLDSFVVNLTITQLAQDIIDEENKNYGIWTIPKTVTASDNKTYPVLGIGDIGYYEIVHKITTVNIPENIKYISSYAFYNNTHIKEINFEKPENIAYIGEKAFYGTGIQKIDLTGFLRSEDGCSVLSREVFGGCESLKEVIINTADSEQIYIPSKTFSGCTALTNISWGKAKTIQIGNEAFYRTNIKELKFDADTKVQIGQYAFKNCSCLSNIQINGDCEIQEGAFYGSMSAESVSDASASFGASVELGGYAFKGCKKLKDITFASTKQSGYSTVVTATPTPNISQSVTPTGIVTPTESLSPTPTPRTEVIPYGETVESYRANNSNWDSWYRDYVEKNPEKYLIVTATPTPGATSTPTPTPLPEVKKGSTVTLYKECLLGSGIKSIEINADHINLHMECLSGIELDNLKLGGTILNMYGNLLNETDNLTDIIISSTQVLFLNDIDDTCYVHYKPSYEEECSSVWSYMDYQVNYNSSQNMGAFTMSKGYVNLIFTKDVELISGDYSGTIAHASDSSADSTDCANTKYYDKISNIYFLNPNIRFVTGANTDIAYCGLKGFFHLHTKKDDTNKDEVVNIYGYDFTNKKTDNNTTNTNFYYPANDTEKSIAYHGYSSYVARAGFEQYVSQCAKKETFNYQNIQDNLTAEYESGTAIVGTKFDPSKLVVKQTYNTSLTNADSYTATLENEGVTTGNVVGSTGFRYSIPAGVLDNEGNFKMPEKQNSNNVQINIYHGSQVTTATINILSKNSSSFEVEYPKFVVGKTLKLEDFKIKNLVFNDGEKIASTDLDKLSEKYVVKVTFMDATKAPIAYMGSNENMASSYKVEKQLSKVLVTIIDNSELKEDISVLDEAPAELNVTLKDTAHVFYENDKSTDLKDLFDIKVISNNGTVSENALKNTEYTITEEALKAGENTLHFVYTNTKGEKAEGTYILNAIEEYPVKFFAISTMYENIGIVENSIIDINTFDISMELNSGRTGKLTSEEKMEHCTIAGKIDIVAGQYSNVTIQYKDTAHNIDVSSTATVLGIAKDIDKLSAYEKTSVSAETPAKIWYVGDTITKDDITVIAYYNNGTEKEDDYKNYTIENPVLSGTTNKVVIYRTDKKSVKTELEINAVYKTLLRIEVSYNGNKEIPEGSEINKNNLVVKAIYDNGEVILSNDEYTLEYQILNNKECTVTVWYNKMKDEFRVDGTAPVAKVTTAPTATPTTTKAPTTTTTKATQTENQTFDYSFSNKKVKLVDTNKKTTYKTILKKNLTIKASLTDGKVYYQIVKAGKKVSSKKWKTLNKSVVIKTNGKMSVYVKYTLNGKTITKKTTGFVLDTTAPKIKVAKTGKITVTDSVSGVKSIKDGKKTIKNKTVLSKGVHKITVTDKAGNKKTVKVTIK